MNLLEQKPIAHLPFLPQTLKLNIPKGVRREFLGVFLIIPFLVLVDLGPFDVLALGIATLANILPEQDNIDRKEQISLSLLKEFIMFLEETAHD